MGVYRTDTGFTIVEMVVALVVMSLFLTMLFQLYTINESQRVSVLRRAAANDIAATNLDKVPTIALIPAGTTACDNTTNGSGNPNNLLKNSSAAGSTIATNATTGTTTPTWATAGLTAESTTSTTLPSGTTQSLVVVYPQGCTSGLPAKIVSTVTYSTPNGTESVQRAAFVN